VCFRKPVDDAALLETRSLLQHVGEVVKIGCGDSWDGVALAVGMPQSTKPFLEKSFEEWEELCQESGFEYIDLEARGLNEYSERMGIERLKEVLEANDWERGSGLDAGLDAEDSDGADETEENDTDFGIEATEMRMEMLDAIYNNRGPDEEMEDDVNQDEEVEKLQSMMLKMQAVKDMGADLRAAERKAFAAEAVKEMMEEL